jgi:hypothetical protein
MQDLHGAPVVEGDADVKSQAPVEFRDEKTGRVTRVTANAADGKFRAQVPQGKYAVTQGGIHTTLTALSGGVYHVDLQREQAFDFQVSAETSPSNEVKLRIHAEGSGVHTLEIRTSNLEFKDPAIQKIELRSGNDVELTRSGKVTAPETPWVIVVIPDGALNEHREVTGTGSAAK